jgi:hypothetical protein
VTRPRAIARTALRALPLLVVLLVFGCSQILGADDYAVAPPVVCGGVTTFDAEAPSCAACIRAYCCQEETACADLPGCVDMLACFTGCDYASCILGCITEGAPAHAAVDSLFQCRSNCREPCAMGKHWSCAGHVTYPSLSGLCEYRLRLRDVVTLTGVSGIMAQACTTTDLECMSPIATGMSGADGVVSLNVPREQAFYVSLSGGGYMPALYYSTDPPQKTLATGVNDGDVVLETPAVVQFAASQVDVTVMADKGQIAFAVLDCLGDQSLGVSVTISTSQGSFDASYYLQNGTPVANAGQTDSSGIGAIVNVPTGLAVLSATLRSTGKLVAKQGVLVKAGTITNVRVGPTPL